MKWHVFAMLFSIVFGALGLGIIVTQTTPDSASNIVIVSLFLALFITLLGLVSLASFWVSMKRDRNRAVEQIARRAYIHGTIGATIIVAIIIIT